MIIVAWLELDRIKFLNTENIGHTRGQNDFPYLGLKMSLLEIQLWHFSNSSLYFASINERSRFVFRRNVNLKLRHMTLIMTFRWGKHAVRLYLN